MPWRGLIINHFFFAELCSPIQIGETHAASPSICTTRK
jgi:hypothetical protein